MMPNPQPKHMPHSRYTHSITHTGTPEHTPTSYEVSLVEKVTDFIKIVVSQGSFCTVYSVIVAEVGIQLHGFSCSNVFLKLWVRTRGNFH